MVWPYGPVKVYDFPWPTLPSAHVPCTPAASTRLAASSSASALEVRQPMTLSAASGPSAMTRLYV